MKKGKKVLVGILCGALLSVSTWAGTLPERNNPVHADLEVGMYRVKNSLTMKVLVEKNLGEKVVVRLLDHKGQVLHEEIVGKRTEKFARDFNFSQIHDGRYRIEVSNGSEVIERAIKLSTTDLIETPARTLVAVN